jgi:hypothetical protein
MLGTTRPDGPNLSPKGSMIVLDDDRLAFWARGEIGFPGGIMRSYGTAEIIERGAERDRIRTLLQPREIDHDGAEEGYAVMITLDRAENIRGESIR